MNYTQKKWIRAIGLCAGLILCGVIIAAVAIKLRLPVAYGMLGFAVGLVGAGGIGAVIALYADSIPHQDKYRTKRLQAKAWKDLVTCLYSLIVGAISFYVIIQKGGDGKNLIILALAIILGIWIPVGQLIMKKRTLRGLDERERLIHERAKAISDSFFAGFCLMGLFGLWGCVGFKTSVPVYIPVLIVFGLGAIAEILRPVLILIQCKMEQTDNQSAEGELA